MRGFTCLLSHAKFLPVEHSAGLSAFLDVVGEIIVSSGNPGRPSAGFKWVNTCSCVSPG